MKVTPNLLKVQYDDYPRGHMTRANLILHLVTAPLYCIGVFMLFFGLVQFEIAMMGAGLFFMILVIAIQGFGHSRESGKPMPFLSPLDFIVRLSVENTFTFWRFVANGGWNRAWQIAGKSK